VDPPKGGTGTTTITDALGRTLEVRHYRGDAPNELLGYDAATRSQGGGRMPEGGVGPLRWR
jgi:hypothetical protein